MMDDYEKMCADFKRMKENEHERLIARVLAERAAEAEKIAGPDPRDAEIAALKAAQDGIHAVGYREGVLAERQHSLKATADGNAEIARLKAEVERLTARAERAEAEAEVRSGRWCEKNRNEGRGGCGMCGWCCKQSREDRDLAIIEAAGRTTERDRALAACAEMRAALECAAPHHQGGHSTVGRMIRDALSRPDLGAGKVLVERGVLEGVLSEHEARVGECNCGICYPIHALLKKGGG